MESDCRVALDGLDMTLLVLAADGHSHREIAEKLRLSEQTVKNKFSALYRKMGAKDKAHAIAIAMRGNIIV